MNTSSRKGVMGFQAVWLADLQKSITLTRAAWFLKTGQMPGKGQTVWRTCLNGECGNPAHMRKGTKAQHGAWVVAQGYLRGTPERSESSRRLAQRLGKTRLTMELAQWVRESQQGNQDVAHALGEHHQVVSKIRTGQTWRPRAVASVWAWGMAA